MSEAGDHQQQGNSLRPVVGQVAALLQVAYQGRFLKSSTTDSQDQLALWQRLLKVFSEQTILRAAELTIDAYPQHPPTIGQFRKLCLEEDARRLQHQADKPQPSKVCPNCKNSELSQAHVVECRQLSPRAELKFPSYAGDKREAWNACKGQFARKFGTNVPSLGGFYDGDFPVQMVVGETDITDSKDMRDHDSCWRELNKNFEKQWAVYQ